MTFNLQKNIPAYKNLSIYYSSYTTESEAKELPTYKEFYSSLLATIKRPDIVDGGNVGNVGNDVGNDVGNRRKVQLTERQRRIYHLIAATPDVTAQQMSELFATTKRTIERDLAVMQKNNIIRHEGKARTGHWVVLELA